MLNATVTRLGVCLARRTQCSLPAAASIYLLGARRREQNRYAFVFAQSNMNKQLPCRVCCIVSAAVFVSVVIYNSNNATDKVTSILRYVPEVSPCQPLSVGGTNGMVNSTSCVTGRPCVYSDVVDFRAIVITFNRADSLSKLLRSLDTLVLDGQRAALEIWIDRDRKNSVDQRTLKVASTFNWTGGHTRVHVQVGSFLYC